MRTVLFIVALAVVATACGGTETDPQGPGRLVIIDDAGNIATLAPDGGELTTFTDDGGGRITYFQPIWSPDGARLGATRAAADGFSIEIIDVATGEQASTTTTSNSFYSYWSPDGSHLAYLSSVTPTDLALDVIAVEVSDPPERLGLGQPLYFAWNPDSVEVVAHVGADRLEILGSEPGSPELPPPGDFLSPQWTERGILHVGIGGGRQQLMLTQPDGETESIALLSGGAVFTATADGERIAILPTGGDDIGSTVAAFQVPLLPAGRLLILDRGGSESVEVDVEFAVAFFWDPTGTRLLILEFTEAGAFRWKVWDDDGTTTFPDFVPAPGLLRDLVPFFDQYAQSMTLWSPDGSTFAYPGVVDGEEGIWVQEIAGANPQRIAGGSWVAWSGG